MPEFSAPLNLCLKVLPPKKFRMGKKVGTTAEKTLKKQPLFG